MREILFRGKSPENGEWVYGYYVHNGPVNSKTGYIIPYYASDFYGFQVYPSTVGQYTGMKDKNGKRIFEGDIVKTDKFSEPNKQYIIKYDLQFGAFIGQDRYNVYFVTFDGDSGEFEVIGNVTDNPELLEK